MTTRSPADAEVSRAEPAGFLTHRAWEDKSLPCTCSACAEIDRLRSEVSAQTAIAHEAQAVQRIYAAQLDAEREANQLGWRKAVLAEARLAAVARMARNLHANGNRVLAEDLLRAIEGEQT